MSYEMLRIVETPEVGIKTFKIESAELATFAMEECETGYARTAGAGLTVQKGTSGTLNYSITMNAVDSRTLDKKDIAFQAQLTQSEKVEFSKKKASFSGGLDIPFLHWIGCSLDASVTKEDMKASAEKQVNYSQKASAAKEILKEFTQTRTRISGSLKAHGVSFIPTTVYAYIKLAQVTFSDGSKMNVVSASAADAKAATSNGEVVPSSDSQLNIMM